MSIYESETILQIYYHAYMSVAIVKCKSITHYIKISLNDIFAQANLISFMQLIRRNLLNLL